MSARGDIRAAHPATSRSDWETPDALYNPLDGEFRFTLDAAASPGNALAPRYLTGPHQDGGSCACGICADWGRNVVWLNPPYGSEEWECLPGCSKARCIKRGWHRTSWFPGMRQWVGKCATSAAYGATVVALLPNATETEWFANVWATAWEIRLLTPRVQYEIDGEAAGSNTAGSVIVVWRPGQRPYGAPVVTLVEWLKRA